MDFISADQRESVFLVAFVLAFRPSSPVVDVVGCFIDDPSPRRTGQKVGGVALGARASFAAGKLSFSYGLPENGPKYSTLTPVPGPDVRVTAWT